MLQVRRLQRRRRKTPELPPAKTRGALPICSCAAATLLPDHTLPAILRFTLHALAGPTFNGDVCAVTALLKLLLRGGRLADPQRSGAWGGTHGVAKAQLVHGQASAAPRHRSRNIVLRCTASYMLERNETLLVCDSSTATLQAGSRQHRMVTNLQIRSPA